MAGRARKRKSDRKADLCFSDCWFRSEESLSIPKSSLKPGTGRSKLANAQTLTFPSPTADLGNTRDSNTSGKGSLQNRGSPFLCHITSWTPEPRKAPWRVAKRANFRKCFGLLCRIRSGSLGIGVDSLIWFDINILYIIVIINFNLVIFLFLTNIALSIILFSHTCSAKICQTACAQPCIRITASLFCYFLPPQKGRQKTLPAKAAASCSPSWNLYSTGANSSFPTPHSGHTQSSGRSSKAVPGSIPLSGSPSSGSYTYPQGPHSYFCMLSTSFLILILIIIINIDYILYFSVLQQKIFSFSQIITGNLYFKQARDFPLPVRRFLSGCSCQSLPRRI